MPLPRFRLRTLMIAVAVVGVVVFVGSEAVRLRRLSRLYRQKATDCTGLEAWYRRSATGRAKSVVAEQLVAEMLRNDILPSDYYLKGSGVPLFTASEWERLVDSSGKLADHAEDAVRRYREMEAGDTAQADYHARLASKYNQAARYPWLHVPPDPPMPK